MTKSQSSTLLLPCLLLACAEDPAKSDDTASPDCPEVDTDLDTDEDTDAAPPENQPPTIEELVLTPDPVRTDDVVTATAVISDPEEDELTTTWSWFVDGNLVQTGADATLDGTLWLDKGDTLSVTVETTDGESTSAATTTPVTVANTAPTAPEVVITPEEPLPGDELLCALAAPSTDADEDAIAYTVSWTVNGTPYTMSDDWSGPQTTSLVDDTVPAEDVGRSESWSCTITPDDGEAEGEAGTATVETPEDDTPCHAIQYTDTDASIGVANTGMGVRTGDWTFEFWIRYDGSFTNSPGARSWLFMQNESYSAYAIKIDYDDSLGAIACNTYNNTSGSHNVNIDSPDITDGEWVHIACNYDSGTLTMYVNGEVWGTDTGAPDLQATSTFAWGQERGSYYPDGAYEAAPFSIGPTRLSSAARYSTDFTPDRAWTVDSDTIGQWLVSDGFDGTTLVDEAGGNNDGAYRASVVAAGSCD